MRSFACGRPPRKPSFPDPRRYKVSSSVFLSIKWTFFEDWGRFSSQRGIVVFRGVYNDKNCGRIKPPLASSFLFPFLLSRNHCLFLFTFYKSSRPLHSPPPPTPTPENPFHLRIKSQISTHFSDICLQYARVPRKQIVFFWARFAIAAFVSLSSFLRRRW